jgi:hypothetical protein
LDDCVHLHRLHARSGNAEVQASGKLWQRKEEPDFEGDVAIKHLPVTSELFEKLPASLQKIHEDYSPTGPVELIVHAERKDGQWRKKHCIVHPEDMTATFRKFPYPLEHITGTLEHTQDAEQHREELRLDFTGLAGSCQVFVQGQVAGDWPACGVDVKIWGKNISIDEKLMNALPGPKQHVARSFHPSGLINFEVFVHRNRGQKEFANRYLVHFHDTKVLYDVFPYPLEEVTGTLDILPDHWEFSDLHGTHKGGVVRGAGRFQPHPAGDRLTVQLCGESFALDSELEKALVQPELKHTWETFTPTGRMNFFAQVNRVGDQPPEVETDITALGCAVKPQFFPYLLEDLTGRIHYAKRWVQVENIKARHGSSVLTLERGQIFVYPEGGVWADITNLHGNPLVPDCDLLYALPPSVRSACEAVRLQDPVVLNTRLTVATTAGNAASSVVYWDGQLTFTDANLVTGVPLTHVTGVVACQGRAKGEHLEGLVGNLLFDQAVLYQQPFRQIQGTLLVDKKNPGILVVPGLHARIFGGEVYGPLRIEFGPKVHYDINLTASRIQLEQFGRLNLGKDANLSGLATARLHLQGQGSDISELTGRGSIDVPNGRLYNLPPILDLLKFLSIRLPDGTAFEEAQADFTIQGNRVGISRLDLIGNSISLRGQGEMNLDGSDLNIDFYAVWARVTQMLPPIIKGPLHDMSKYLLKIQMRGRMGDVRFHKEPVPAVVEPLKGLLERMGNMGKGKDAANKELPATSRPGL